MTGELAPFRATPYGAVVHGMRGGTGPPALLIHGVAGSWRNFRPWLPVLLPRCEAIIPDLPGFGDSPVPGLRPSLLTWARLLNAMLDELETPPSILVGLGLGASLALALLQQQPAGADLVRCLVVHTPAYYPGAVRPAFRWGVPVGASGPVFGVLSRALGRPRLRNAVMRALEGPNVPPEDARLLREDFDRTSLEVLRWLAGDAIRGDFRPLLSALPIPTLAIVSERDPFVYASEMQRLRDLMPNAQVLVQGGLMHGWTEDAIVQQRDALAHFLDDVLGNA